MVFGSGQVYAVPFTRELAVDTHHLAAPESHSRSQHPCHHEDRPIPTSGCPDCISHIPNVPNESLLLDNVLEYLARELATPLLDELYSQLWAVGTRSGAHIDALHQSPIKGRSIIASEDPEMHLIVQRDKIFIKPVPLCLLNYQFWATYLSFCAPLLGPSPLRAVRQPEIPFSGSIRGTALGFLRSYTYLIVHPLDFALAKQHGLMPDGVDWRAWSQFAAAFSNILDDDVSRRYHYGQLRVSRLNWLVRITRPVQARSAWFYYIPHWSIEIYLARILAPFVFIFACLSLVLSAMQVMVALPSDRWTGPLALSIADLGVLLSFFWVFCLTVLFAISLIGISILVIPAAVLLQQLAWGFFNNRKPRSRLQQRRR